MKAKEMAEGESSKEKKEVLSNKWLMVATGVLLVGCIVLGALLATSDDDDTASQVASPAASPSNFEEMDLSCGLGQLSGRLATKNIYQNRIQVHELAEEVEGNYFPTFLEEGTCSLDKVYVIARHGTRYPTDGSAEEMQLFGFNMDMDLLDEGLLLPIGKDELYQLGKRYKARYETILDTQITYHPRIYDFNSSAKVRSLESGESFAQGFFETAEDVRPIVAIKTLDEDNDAFLRYHSNCELHDFVEDREDEGSDAFILQQIADKYRPIVAEHFAHLEIEGDIMLYANVLYTACPFEQALGCANLNSNDYDGTACDLINNETIIEIMEYLADAEDYYAAGLGNQVNMDMSCVLRNEIIDFLEGRSAEIEQMDFRLGFAHSEVLIPLMVHFNFSFYQDADEILENNLFTVDNDVFSDEVRNRNYRMSMMSPLGNNLVFETYSCDGTTMLVILHNEIIVFEGLLADFLEISNFFDENCNFEEMCSVPV